jgi:hypothetical protein
MYRSTSPARNARLRAEFLAARPRRVTVQVFTRVTPATAAAIAAEVQLYAVRPSRSAVINQLIVEGLAFRRAHRPDPVAQARAAKRRRGEPFVIDVSDWPK